MKQGLRIVILLAVVAAFVAPVAAEPPPKLTLHGQYVEERSPVKLPGMTRKAEGGETSAAAMQSRKVAFTAVDRYAARHASTGPMLSGGEDVRGRGALAAAGGSAVYGPREAAERELRRVQRQLF